MDGIVHGYRKTGQWSSERQRMRRKMNESKTKKRKRRTRTVPIGTFFKHGTDPEIIGRSWDQFMMNHGAVLGDIMTGI